MKYLTCLFAILTILSCQNTQDETETSKKNIEAYYYPVKELVNPLVYEYQSVNNDSLGNQYWYFNTIMTDTAAYFTANLYNDFFEVEQLSIEEYVSNGMLQKEYLLYGSNLEGQQIPFPAEIEYANAFPFEVSDSLGVFLQKMKWTFSEEPLHTTTLIRNRRYIGDDRYTDKGQEKEAVVFSVQEVIDDFNNGSLETKTNGTEIYAKDLGLVYFKKRISENFVLEYELSDIYSMDQLEQKFKAMIVEQEK